jgi:uncharacterized protein
MQSLSVVTLGVVDLGASQRFYVDGFGWSPVFQNEEIIFYQLNGIVLGTFAKAALEEDMQRFELQHRGAFALAHNVPERTEVDPLMDRLAAAGGKVLRPADAPPHGGYRGYIADPDQHTWEIAWNPGFSMDGQGNVTFGI